MFKKQYDRTLKPVAQYLRNCLTPAEGKLWRHLRLSQVRGVRFYSQSIVGNVILDFYAPEIKLAIEVDGSHHFEPDQIAKDSKRDAFLGRLGIEVLRFDNGQIYNSLNLVLEEIYRVVGERR